MALSMSLRCAESVGAIAFSSDSDDEVGFLADVCDALADATAAVFTVDGFGLPWPVDVRTDLAVIVEQLPRVIRRLRAGEQARLEFYEQGIERIVEIAVVGDHVQMVCRNLVGGDQVGVSTGNLREFLGEIEALWRSFSDLVQHRVTDAWSNAHMTSFRDQMEAALDGAGTLPTTSTRS